MYPELFRIPFTDLTVKSYGTLMVIGFLLASWVMRRLSRREGLDPVLITNAALYSLMVGVIGARLFFVVHHSEEFRGEPWWTVLAVWNGGLELLGGVALAVTFLLFYLWRTKTNMRRALDILAMGLMLGLAFGRVGCFLNGCCWGKPSDLPWAVRFPYDSLAYVSQINTDPDRGREQPYLKIPKQAYCTYSPIEDKWYPKNMGDLTEQQRYEVTQGAYRSLPVHPTQWYSSLSALLIFSVLLGFWRKGHGPKPGVFKKPGTIFPSTMILYGLMRFLLEFVRDDNPFEWGLLTVSQLIAIALVILGVVLFGVILGTGEPRQQP